MRQKTEQIVLSFPTTSAAMQAEEVLLCAGVTGRLIPLPREISADCGLAWKSPLEEEAKIDALQGELRYQEKARVLLY